MVYSVLVADCHALEYQQGSWVLGSYLVQCWRHNLICMVFRGSNNTLKSVPNVP